MKRIERFDIKIPTRVILIITICFCIFIISGGIYDLINNPRSIIPTQSGYLTVHPYLDEQTLNESIFAIITNSAMFLGLFFAYKSTNTVNNTGKANRYLIFAIGLTLAGLSGNYYIIALKRAINI